MNNPDLHVARPGQFYGVYILYNVNPKFKGRIYIGFTVNPVRRIRQHNREIKGGAWKTYKGPWEMVLIVHGFPTKLAALQFEWAWQKPKISVRLKHLDRKRKNEPYFPYQMRILSEMLNTGPWCRLPLVIQWLKQDYEVNFPVSRQPPLHMSIAYGPISIGKLSEPSKRGRKKKALSEDGPSSQMENTETDPVNSEEEIESKCCKFCGQIEESNNKMLSCVIQSCTAVGHMTCFAEYFLKQKDGEFETFLIPVSGKCPDCKTDLLWKDLIQQKKVVFDTADDEVESDSEQSSQCSQEEEEEDFENNPLFDPGDASVDASQDSNDSDCNMYENG